MPDVGEPDLASLEAAPESDALAGTDQGEGGHESNEDLIKLAREIYEAGFDKDRDNQDQAYEDLKFIAGENQWDPTALQQRTDEDRPALVVNQCPQFVRQVTGDMRQMRPAIKVVPTDDAGSKDVAAKVLPGLIRYVETRSDASGIYFAAADQQAGAGIGHWMVTHEYAAARTFNQEIRIAPVPDGIAVVWDADAVLLTREDATDCFVPYDMSQRTFKKKYPGKSADPLTSSSESTAFSLWSGNDQVRVAIWFHKVPEKKRLALFEDGRIDDVTDDKKAEAQAKQLGAEIKVRDGVRVDRYLISANDILEGPDKVPGPNIPVVPVIGEEITIGSRTVRRGVIRVLRDVQRIYNYAISTQTEIIALQPKAPFVGTREQFEKFADQWETANSRNWPFLEYTHQPGVAPPQRSQPAVASTGLDDLMQITQMAMSSTTGIYPASLGAKSNETSGRAIMARQREGDTGTYVYLDNFARAIRRTGQIIVDMVPEIYDTRRTIQIVGEDGKIDSLDINQAALGDDAEAHVSYNDVTKGAYLVAVEMGPSYSTKREESREGMLEMVRTLGPETGMLFIDLLAKAMDWPLADKIAERAKFMLPPAIQAKEAKESGEQPPEPPPPPPPTREQQAMMAEEQQKNIELARKNELDDREQQLKLKEIAFKERELELKARGQEVEAVGMAANEINASREHEKAMNPPPDEETAAVTTDAQQSEDIDDLKGHVAEITEALMEVRDLVTQMAQAPPPEPPPLPAAPPDYIPQLLDIIKSSASRPKPIGTKRTRDGMSVVYEGDDERPANIPEMP